MHHLEVEKIFWGGGTDPLHIPPLGAFAIFSSFQAWSCYKLCSLQACNSAIISWPAYHLPAMLLYLHLYTSLLFNKLLLINENERMNDETSEDDDVYVQPSAVNRRLTIVVAC